MRIFISHSSKDKARYCNEVANKLIQKLGRILLYMMNLHLKLVRNR